LTEGGLVSNRDVVQIGIVKIVDADETAQLLVCWSRGAL